MGDLLYYYCGGDRPAVLELLVSLYSLLETNPDRPFQVGIALDSESRQWIDPQQLDALGDVSVRIFDDQGRRYCGPGVHHLVNRWQATELFEFDRVIILDTDTIVNRPLDALFNDLPADQEVLTTFAAFFEQDRRWEKHCRFYDAVHSDYDRQPLYCALGMHGFRQGWPYLQEVVATLLAMDRVQGPRTGNRVFLIEEYAVNLTLLRHGRKVCFPRPAIAKAVADLPEEALPFVSHFLLGRAQGSPAWRRMLSRLVDADFLNSAGLVRSCFARATSPS